MKRPACFGVWMRVVEGPPLKVADQSIFAMLQQTASRFGDRDGFLLPDDERKFRPRRWAAVYDHVARTAEGLRTLGVKQGDRVAIYADPSPEWMESFLALQGVGAVVVPIYPTLTADQVAFVINDAEVSRIFVDAAERVDRLVAVKDKIGDGLGIIALPGGAQEADAAGWTMLRQADLKSNAAGQIAQAHVAEPGMDDPACIIYTSGTTGVPKGAVLTQRNWVASIDASIEALELGGPAQHTVVAFLPLAHVAGLMKILLFIRIGGSIAFSDPRNLAHDLQTVRPTVIGSVPRVYERIVSKIKDAVADGSPLKQKLFARAYEVAMLYGKATMDNGRARLMLRVRHWFYNRLIFTKLRKAIGFDRIQVGVAGAASVRSDLLLFLQGIGAHVVEGYGLTETAAIVVTNSPSKWRAGSVGMPVAGTKVALDDDGEILINAPHVFAGYLGRPEENEATFVEMEGIRWLRTGDIGTFDDDGNLRIVDRKKELEVLDTGKKVAPVQVEDALRSTSDFVADSCVVGTGQRFLGALVQPDFDRLVRWAKEEARIDFDDSAIVIKPDPAGNMMTYSVGQDLLHHPKVQELYAGIVQKCNGKLADFERVKSFRLIPDAFTMDRDELTPTLKKKRRIIREHYGATLDDMFAPRVTA